MQKLLLFLFFSIEVLFASGHIFVYHRFGDSEHASTNTTLKQLREQFEYFKKHNYKVVKLSDMVEKIEKKESIPDNWVALTIDDSYKSFYTNGFKIFKEYGYPFSLYVYVEATDRHYHDFMTWDQVREISKYGELGLHSYGHPRLTKISLEAVKNDTLKGIELFEKNLGFKPQSYAYPYGEYNKDVEEVIKNTGFRYICNQNSGAVESYSDIYDIDRIAIVGKTNLAQLLKIKPLNVVWEDIKRENNTITHIKLKLPNSIKKGELYVSGHGWKRVKAKDSILDLDLNYKIKSNRTRIIFRSYNNEHSSKIIVK